MDIYLNLRQGTYICVAPKAVLTFQKSKTWTSIGSDSKIICYERIDVGGDFRLTWDCQIYDTNFHYIKNEKGEVSKLTKPILIGNNCWVANRSTIGPGTLLPNYSIIASNSLVKKDLSEYGERCLFAGVPVQCKKQGVERVFSNEEERELNDKYGYNFVVL